MKKTLLIVSLLLGLAFLGTYTAHAQNEFQSTPVAYRGIWKLAKSSWSMKSESKYLIVKARYVKHPVFTLGGKRLGVYVGKHYVSYTTINSKGKRTGENFILRRTHFKGQVALKVNFDAATQYYIKK